MEKSSSVLKIVTIALGLPTMSMPKASFKLNPIMKGNNGRKLRKLYAVCKQHIRAIELSDYDNLDTFLTISMELKKDKVTRLK